MQSCFLFYTLLITAELPLAILIEIWVFEAIGVTVIR